MSKPYVIDITDGGELTINGEPFPDNEPDWGEAIKDRLWSGELVEAMMNNADPDGLMDSKTRIVVASILHALIYQIVEMTRIINRLDSDLYSHEHTTKTVPVVRIV